MDTNRGILGTGLVILGTAFLFDQAGVVDAGALMADWWPVLLLVGAGLELLSRPARRVGAAVLGTLGLVLLGITTGVLGSWTWSILWPSSVIAFGIWLLVRSRRSDRARVRRDAVHDSDLDVAAVFAGRRVVSMARPFHGGRATAMFGGVDLDLSGATIDDDAILDLVAVFGGVDVTVPTGWRVLVDGPAIFGGHDNHAPAPMDPDAPTLHVRATAVFGGVDVKAVSLAPPVQDHVR